MKLAKRAIRLISWRRVTFVQRGGWAYTRYFTVIAWRQIAIPVVDEIYGHFLLQTIEVRTNFKE